MDRMDSTVFESLLNNTMSSLQDVKDLHSSTFSTYFTTLLEDCENCITQCLDLIVNILNDLNIDGTKVCEYIEDAVGLLQMMSHFIKSVVESVSMPCCTMSCFPTAVGQVIQLIFTHCRDSEILYGSHLRSVEKQLKDLFRTCHELQLTYLMILEKHFIFDLTEKIELEILLKALDINLKIGEIVQTLDVKTMAEQWKAYTMLCDKYSSWLEKKGVYYDSTKVLCKMIESHVKSATEIEQEEKVTLRSLKIANFAIKILLKVCTIFKHATINYDHIIDLLVYLHLNNSAYLELKIGGSNEYLNAVNNNILTPVTALLKELLLNETFTNQIKLEKYYLEEDKSLGGIILTVSIMKILLENGKQQNKLSMHILIDTVFKFLPYGHIWFNLDLKFEIVTNEYRFCGLYEYLLTYTMALAAIFNSDEVKFLEKKMYEAILDTDCIAALFASNLWILLARLSRRQYVMSQILSLCNTYQKLENNKLFAKSPQQVHLSYTLRGLFEVLSNEYKICIYKQFTINDERNTTLWTALCVSSLPEALQNDAEEFFVEKLTEQIHGLLTSGIKSVDEINNLNNTMKLAGTLSSRCESILEDQVVQAWLKACPESNKFLPQFEINTDYLWYIDYIEALVSLTNSMRNIFRNGNNTLKILHVITNMICGGNTEVKLALIDTGFRISSVLHEENKQFSESLQIKLFKSLLEETDLIVKNKFFNVLRRYRDNRQIQYIISNVITEDTSLQELWDQYSKHIKSNFCNVDVKQELKETMQNQYSHKCIEDIQIDTNDTETYSVPVVKEASGKNFDLADIDTLFDFDSDTEPACKKIKLNGNDVEEIVSRLENDVSLLYGVKENVLSPEHMSRIKTVCEKLKHIID